MEDLVTASLRIFRASLQLLVCERKTLLIVNKAPLSDLASYRVADVKVIYLYDQWLKRV